MFGDRQTCVQRNHLGTRRDAAGQRVRRLTDVTFGGQKHQDVATGVAAPPQLVDGGVDALDLVEVGVLAATAFVTGVGAVGGDERAVADVDGVRPPRHLEDGDLGVGCREMPRKSVGFDRRRRDDELEVGATGEQSVQVAEDEIDVEASFMRLVDDQRVVGAQHRIGGDLAQQDAVGHHLHESVGAGAVREPHRVPHGIADLGVRLVGDTPCHGTRGDTPRLGVTDGAAHASAELQADLGKLGGLARSGFARDHHDLVSGDRGCDLVAGLRDR